MQTISRASEISNNTLYRNVTEKEKVVEMIKKINKQKEHICEAPEIDH